jgi:hypothetical protein
MVRNHAKEPSRTIGLLAVGRTSKMGARRCRSPELSWFGPIRINQGQGISEAQSAENRSGPHRSSQTRTRSAEPQASA